MLAPFLLDLSMPKSTVGDQVPYISQLSKRQITQTMGAPSCSPSLRKGGKKSRVPHVSRFWKRGIAKPQSRSGSLGQPNPRELTTKRRGELAELAFTYKAATMGFGVAKPYGDSERYDFVLDAGGRFLRVQVKSSTTLLNGLYHVNCHRRTGGRAVAYSPSEIDFLVAYIIPEDAWFILPITVVAHFTSLLFNPKGYARGDGLFGAYREAWHLLREFQPAPSP